MTDAEIVDKLNSISLDAFVLIAMDWAGMVILGKTALAVPRNDSQRNAFEELLKAGFVYLDSERGQVGFRSTNYGIIANSMIKASRK